MSLVTDEPVEQPIAKPEPLRPRPAVKEYQDNVIDTKEVDHSSLLTFISGSSWTVNFYSQVLGGDQVGTTQQTDQSNVYQQYRKYIGFEFKVQSQLSQDQDQETKAFEVVGTSNIYPSITPNVGDMFVADVGDGRSAIFTVTSTRRLTIYQETGYEISYKLTNYSTKELMDDLESKVVESKYFDKKGLQKGADAFLTKKEMVTRDEIHRLLESLTGAYVRRFWDKQHSTIVYRNELKQRIYDHFLVEFVKKLAVPWDKIPNGMNCNGIEFFDNPTIWDSLLDGERQYVDQTEYMEEIKPSSLSQFPALGGLAWSKIELARRPVHGKLPVAPLPTFENGVPDYHPSTLGGHYALSSWFYNDQPDGMSKLEKFLAMWFEGKSLDTTELVKLAKSVHTWDDLSRFYQTPIVMVLLLHLES